MSARNVSSEMAAQEELLDLTQRNEYLAKLLDLAEHAMVVRHLRDGVIYWNKASEKLRGYSFEEVRGQHNLEFMFDDPDVMRVAYEHAVTHGTWSGETVERHRDGHRLIVDLTLQTVHDQSGDVTALYGVAKDVTQAREELTQRVRAQRLESIGTLAGGIAHDLNNTLTPIVMSLDLLARRELGEDERQLVDAMRRSAFRAAEMVRQVLTFARGVEGERTIIDPRDLLEEIGLFCQSALPKSIDVSVSSTDDVPFVVGDATQLTQVLMNLVTNARDAMSGSGSLSIEAQCQQRDGRDWVEMTVRDDGAGMDDATIERIFEPFFSTKDFGLGSGLGLSTSLAIVESHQGLFEVESVRGHGTTMRVMLPATSETPIVEESTSTSPSVARESRILIVDDEEDVRTLLEIVLLDEGYEVSTVSNGIEALELCRSTRFDVVVSDFSMPNISGVEFASELRHIDKECALILMSGLDRESADLIRGLGPFTTFLPKPFSTRTLLDTIARARAS